MRPTRRFDDRPGLAARVIEPFEARIGIRLHRGEDEQWRQFETSIDGVRAPIATASVVKLKDLQTGEETVVAFKLDSKNA